MSASTPSRNTRAYRSRKGGFQRSAALIPFLLFPLLLLPAACLSRDLFPVPLPLLLLSDPSMALSFLCMSGL